jgi:hypothetical protein
MPSWTSLSTGSRLNLADQQVERYCRTCGKQIVRERRLKRDREADLPLTFWIVAMLSLGLIAAVGFYASRRSVTLAMPTVTVHLAR